MDAKPSKKEAPAKSQFALLTTRRFGPFFWTQLWGAFNDNLYKTALVVLLAFEAGSGGGSHLMVNVAAGLFILPFFLFSGLAGQLADKYEVSALICKIKAAEIVIMGIGAGALLLDQTWLQLATLFAMGAQSAFFGPVKYSLLPQYLKTRELVGGNAMVEMGTFTAILAGTILGSVLVGAPGGRGCIALFIFGIALVGWWSSRRIPVGYAARPSLRINWSPISETRHLYALARKDKVVFIAILGISWFWFLGAAYVTQMPTYARTILVGGPGLVTPLLAAFTIGVAIGSLLCERLSGKQVEPGLVPLGSLLMGIGGWVLAVWRPAGIGETIAWGQLFSDMQYLRVIVALATIGVGGGLFSIPLFTLIQTRSPLAVRSRIIAANNVLNALAMVVSALAAIVALVVLKWPVTHFFAVLATASLIVTVYSLFKTPRYVLRLIVWAATRLCYRIRSRGTAQIPETGAAILVCNHVSYVDAFIIAGSCRRPVRFVMHNDYYRLPGLQWLFRLAGVIPIDSARKNPAILKSAFRRIDQALANGDVVCLFPEGRLTRTGEMGTFRPGIEKILQRNPVPVVPLALRGLWGSVFSHKGGPALRHWPKRIRARVELITGALVAPSQVCAEKLRSVVGGLLEADCLTDST